MKIKCKYVEALKGASSFLEGQGKEGYLAEYMLIERQGWNKTELVSKLRQEMPESIYDVWQQDLKKVCEGIPPQYIIGSCEFFGRRFKVTEATLIPRPETEELVEACLVDNKSTSGLKVLDIGTGTGAIGLTLKHEVPSWDVTAIDISSEALAIAKKNKLEFGLDVRLVEGDLIEPVQTETFDIIVSNPPYIAEDEWDVMDESVREHEPKLALFAPNKGLEIYQRLAKSLPSITHEKSKIYLEIGYLQGEAVVNLFKKAFPKHNVRCYKDFFGQDRMVIVTPI